VKKDTDNVSEICNKLADKHDLNVTVVRDLVEDLRRKIYRTTYKNHGTEGFDIYMALHGKIYCWSTVLARSRKPAKPARKRG